MICKLKNIFFRIVELEEIEVGKIVTEAFECTKKSNLINQHQHSLNQSIIQFDDNDDEQHKSAKNRPLSSESSFSLFRMESPLGILDETKEKLKSCTLTLNENDLFDININEMNNKANLINMFNFSEVNNDISKINPSLITNTSNIQLINPVDTNPSASEFVSLDLNSSQDKITLWNAVESDKKQSQNEFVFWNPFTSANNQMSDLLIASQSSTSTMLSKTPSPKSTKSDTNV